MNVDRRGLSRPELHQTVKAHGLKIRGKFTSRNMIAALDAAGIEWGKADRNTASCPQCGGMFDPKGPKTGPGRDKKFCSDLCRKKSLGLKLPKSEPRPCVECGVDFLPPITRGSSPVCCSIACNEVRKAKIPKSEKTRNPRKPKIKNCRKCGDEYQRPNTLFCSESCRVQHKKESKQSYGNLPHIAEKRKAKARQLSKTDQYKQKRNARARDHLKQKRQTDPIYLLKERIRCRTKAAFNGIGFAKGCKTREMIGCSWDQFKIHIESQFEKGMKWSNRHLWHIDHIIPLAEGKTVEQLEKLSHFSNLRPMWAVDNIAKKDNPVDCQPELRISYE